METKPNEAAEATRMSSAWWRKQTFEGSIRHLKIGSQVRGSQNQPLIRFWAAQWECPGNRQAKISDQLYAFERNPEEVRRWLDEHYASLRKQPKQEF